MTSVLLTNEPLANHNSWRVGGVAKVFFMPQSVDDLAHFLTSNTLPVLYLGLGSNVLINDKGFDGVVICTKKLNQLTFNKPHIEAAAGVGLAKLARFSNRHQVKGMAFFAGIPGTVGGALAMNAGAFGSETWQCVNDVTTIDNNGKLNTRTHKDFEVGYRSVIPHYPTEHFIGAAFSANQSNEHSNHIQDLLKKRNTTQPIGLASAGSVFKNPKPLFAGELIERAGLKGHRIGGAIVSEKHANFIINDGCASADDIKQLIAFIQQQVQTKLGVQLATEVKIIE